MGKTQGLRHRIARWGLGLAGLLAPLSAQAVEASPAPPAGSASGGFASILWLHGGPVRDAAFFAAVKAAGYSAVSVSGGADPALPAKHGLGYYHDQLCGKGILELRAEQYQPILRAYESGRDAATLLRPGCLAESATLATLASITGERLRRTLPHQPWAISLGDEISTTRHANPLDLCFAPASLRSFRKFVAARYGQITALNRRWRTDFASFARVQPFTADAIRRRELGAGRLPECLEPWAAHREFMDRELARVVGAMCKLVARSAPSVAVGLTGIQPPSAYGGHAYARLLPHCSFYEVYDIGGARDLAMCQVPVGATQVATMFAAKGGVSRSMVRAQLADLIAHGMSGVVVWSAGLVFDAQRRPTAYGQAMSAALRQLGRVANRFAGATMRRSSVWMVESQASVRAWWMLDSRADRATWIKRKSSYEATHSTSLAARHAWIRLLEDLGLQPRLVAAAGLAQALAGERPKVIILPANIAMSDAVAKLLRDYVETGGVLLADHSVGLYDERLLRRTRPALDPLFGVQGRRLGLADQWVVGGRADSRGRLKSGAAVAEAGLRAAVSELLGGRHLQLEREVGRGRTCYLNMAVCEYGGLRLKPRALAAALDIRRRVRFVLRAAGVVPPVYLRAEHMPTCLERMLLRGRDGSTLLAVRVNALESPELLAELIKRGSVGIELSFPRATELLDLHSGEVSPSAMVHKLRLDPSIGLFLRVGKDR